MGRRAELTTGAVALLVFAAVVTNAVADNVTVAWTCYLGVLVGAGIGAWIGAVRAPRGQRLVPGLIAVGLTLTALGDVLWAVLERMGADTDVSIADAAWFGSYVALCTAMWVVLRRTQRGTGVDADLILDVATIVAVCVMIFWSISIDTIVADHSVAPFVRAVWAAYPIADAVLLALVVRVLMTRSARVAVGTSFAVGACLWLAADIAYLQWTGDAGATEVIMETGWMVAPVLMARAAWRTGGMKADASDSPSLGWVTQMLVAVGPLLVPPAIELTADLRNQPDHQQLLVGTAALVSLAFVRAGRLIREKERTQFELGVARDAALDASSAKSMFLANLSHEIRTPLTTVLATGEMLEDTPLDDLQLKLVAKMHRSGQLLRTLVEEILDFSRIEAGQLKLSSTAFDLHVLVADTAESYGLRATQAGVRFECQLDPRLPQMVIGDPGRLLQILTNFLENALKFTDQGQITMVIQSEDLTDGAGQCVEFMVVDTGIGIREEDQASIFESFKQVDGSATRHHGGNGLGLAICKDLAELMGGSITLQSQFGVGSTFAVRIPLAPETLRDPTVTPALSLSKVMTGDRAVDP